MCVCKTKMVAMVGVVCKMILFVVDVVQDYYRVLCGHRGEVSKSACGRSGAQGKFIGKDALN